MSGDRSTRNALAAILLVAALFVAMNLAVSGAALLDWWLPLALVVIGLVFAFLPGFGLRSAPVEDLVPDSSAPRLPATVHDFEAADFAAPAPEALLPFPEAGAAKPAPELNHMAHTEYADPDEAVAKSEPQPPPPPDDSITATDHSEPEKEVVAEKMAAPQQAYEAEQVGEITPERAESVMNGDATDAPVITEAASPRMSAQETAGEGAVGSSDDLVKIDGIGEKSAAALRAAGIDSFEKLANSSVDTLREAITSAGVRLVGEVDTWAQQAAYAARGDWEGMDNFNRERKARNA
jgi:predicted flap endonuclease-1-like 5' DNA nuclease